MVAFIGLVAGVLVIAVAGSIVLTNSAARHQATQQLATEAKSLTGHYEPLATLKVVRRVLNLEDARLIRVRADGVIAPATPPGLTSEELSPQRLLDGETVSGQDGALSFAAAPVTLTPHERLKLRLAGQYVVVLTRDVGNVGPGWGYFFASGAVALFIAGLVAWQLSRRMSRPLVEAMEATARLAAGDLEGRVPLREHDYPESSSLAHSINEMAQSLEDGRSRERQLLLSVSHDLRTPLTSIRGFAEAIMDGAMEDTAKAAEVIIAESRRLERLVGDLLELTKLEANQMSIFSRPTAVAEVVRTTAEGFGPLAARSGVRLTVRLPTETPPMVFIDPDRLAQILANLIENALTYSRTSVVVALSAVDSLPGRGGQVISVQDDGPGIAEADLTKVFDRFYQADHGPSRQFGSGIGLAIVAELAAALGATVRAVSPVNAEGGARFEVTIVSGETLGPAPVSGR